MLPTNTIAGQTVTRHHDDAVLVSLELSAKKWLLTSRLPLSGKISKRWLQAGDSSGLLSLLARLRDKAQEQFGRPVRIVSIQEAGLDGFWIHRLLASEGVESHVVDAASVAAPRRARSAKTDRIDGETQIRTLAAYLRGEPRVCSMVRPPSPEEEDRRRLGREREILMKERIALTNRIRGLFAAQGITAFNPLGRHRRKQLETLSTGDGRTLPACLKRELNRALERIELLLEQIKTVERERDALCLQSPIVAKLTRLKSIGPQFASNLWLEAFYRTFANRRKIAAYSGLAATPWRSGAINQEQGISRAGNPRLRETMIELSWLWLKHQPDSGLSRWFFERVGQQKGRVKRIAIVALARKLLVALWRYVKHDVLPDGAVFKTV